VTVGAEGGSQLDVIVVVDRLVGDDDGVVRDRDVPVVGAVEELERLVASVGVEPALGGETVLEDRGEAVVDEAGAEPAGDRGHGEPSTAWICVQMGP
jgi:hypothetical protein